MSSVTRLGFVWSSSLGPASGARREGGRCPLTEVQRRPSGRGPVGSPMRVVVRSCIYFLVFFNASVLRLFCLEFPSTVVLMAGREGVLSRSVCPTSWMSPQSALQAAQAALTLND